MVESIKSENQKCVFVIGPTASGKSAWALEQAEKYSGSIVNIDSVQVYKGLIVGSAAPTIEEKKIVPHYLYSYVAPPREMTAGEYVKDFYALLEKPIKFPLFIVGGTGFYIQALEKGMFDVESVPTEVRTNLENELAKFGAEKLYAELKQNDPETKIHVNDHYRLVRALEIIRYTGKTPTQLKQSASKKIFPFEHIKVGFDFTKAEYEQRVTVRTKKMLEEGIIEETRFFYDQGFADWAPMQSVGYRETLDYLRDSKSREWLSGAIKQSTMQLIKKQKTWFKRDPSVLWSNQEQSLKQFLS